MAKKSETFVLEQQVLDQARAVQANESISQTELKEAYGSLCDEYNKLLDEARFLTKVSDKLETKLNTANDKLRKYNESLAEEAETVRQQKDAVMTKSKKLAEQKKAADAASNKVRMILIIFVALYLITGVLVWYILSENYDIQKK